MGITPLAPQASASASSATFASDSIVKRLGPCGPNRGATVYLTEGEVGKGRDDGFVTLGFENLRQGALCRAAATSTGAG